MRIHYFAKRTLKSVLISALASAAFVGAAFAQVPSFQTPVTQRNTYSASVVNVVNPGNGDAACLVGSASKTIRVTRVTYSAFDTTAQAAANSVALVKRTTANTGGTSSQPSIAQLDTGTGTGTAATAVLNAYTAVPTAGTGVTMRSWGLSFVAVTTVSGFDASWTPNSSLSRAPTLRGTAQSLCVNYPGTFTTSGPTGNITFEWTEQ
jgi:hypothetical protein